jgi:hypothetical protein
LVNNETKPKQGSDNLPRTSVLRDISVVTDRSPRMSFDWLMVLNFEMNIKCKKITYWS